MSEENHYAIPLFALVDSGKVDLSQPLPDELAEQLGLFLRDRLGIKALSAKLMLLDETPYMVLQGVEAASLPALCSLVDVQRTQLFRYEREDEGTVVLTPLNVKI